MARPSTPDIRSVVPVSPEPGKVDVYVLMTDGSMPGEELLQELQDYLTEERIRPMTDLGDGEEAGGRGVFHRPDLLHQPQ